MQDICTLFQDCSPSWRLSSQSAGRRDQRDQGYYAGAPGLLRFFVAGRGSVGSRGLLDRRGHGVLDRARGLRFQSGGTGIHLRDPTARRPHRLRPPERGGRLAARRLGDSYGGYRARLLEELTRRLEGVVRVTSDVGYDLDDSKVPDA